jgi:hypothetical protein
MKGRFHGWFVSVAGRFELGRWFVCCACMVEASGHFAVWLLITPSLSRMVVVVTACVGYISFFVSTT